MRLGFGYGMRHNRSRDELVAEGDYLHGIDLDVALSDHTLDIIDPVDREGQVVDLPPLTPDQRARVLLEYHEDMTAGRP